MKVIYENEGPEALRLQYKGGKWFLTEDERYEIIYHLRNLPQCTVEELKDYNKRPRSKLRGIWLHSQRQLL